MDPKCFCAVKLNPSGGRGASVTLVTPSALRDVFTAGKEGVGVVVTTSLSIFSAATDVVVGVKTRAVSSPHLLWPVLLSVHVEVPSSCTLPEI